MTSDSTIKMDRRANTRGLRKVGASGCINVRVHAVLCLGALLLGAANAQPAEDRVLQARNAPPFKQLRYDEDYAYLRDGEALAAPLDGIKFIPLGVDGARFLTLGGEIRERYEYDQNSSWGLGPTDGDGYLLQRYMIHADAHFGESSRLFTQLKSGLEDGRVGGPRPTDQDRLDLNQAFVDFRSAAAPVILRIGRQEMSYGSSRLVSFREGPNVRLAFDGVKAILKLPRWQVDTFATRPVQTEPGTFDDRGDPEARTFGGSMRSRRWLGYRRGMPISTTLGSIGRMRTSTRARPANVVTRSERDYG